MANSWKPEVFVEGKWSTNSLRFVTEEEAKSSAFALFSRWTMCEDHRATESDDMPRNKIVDGVMSSLDEGT